MAARHIGRLRVGALITSCLGLGLAGGCLLELEPRVSCGDGYVDAAAGEECEPNLPETWADACSINNIAGTGGRCNPTTCTLEASVETCVFCGDDYLDPGEECDGNTVACPNLNGFALCNDECALDFSVCDKCGDGVVDLDEGEECDYNAAKHCESDEDCQEDEICDLESGTCIEPGGVAPYHACSLLENMTAEQKSPEKPQYTSGVIGPSDCTEKCTWSRASCGFCGDDQIDDDYLDIGPTGNLIPINAETCDGTDVSPADAEEFCKRNCVEGASELTFGCRYECADDCSGLEPPDSVPDDAPVGHPDLACCLAGGTSCAAADPDYPCCWALNPDNVGDGCEPVFFPGDVEPSDYRCLSG